MEFLPADIDQAGEGSAIQTGRSTALLLGHGLVLGPAGERFLRADGSSGCCNDTKGQQKVRSFRLCASPIRRVAEFILLLVAKNNDISRFRSVFVWLSQQMGRAAPGGYLQQIGASKLKLQFWNYPSGYRAGGNGAVIEHPHAAIELSSLPLA